MIGNGNEVYVIVVDNSTGEVVHEGMIDYEQLLSIMANYGDKYSYKGNGFSADLDKTPVLRDPAMDDYCDWWCDAIDEQNGIIQR